MHPKERILLYGSNLWYLGEGMLGPLFAIYAEKIGGDILDITWAWAAYLIVTGVATIILGRFSDHHSSKEKLMVAGYVLNTVCTFAYLLVSKPYQLLIVQVGLGLAVALATPTWEALYAQYEDTKKAGAQWGLADGQSTIITGVGVILGGLVAVYLSFTWLFAMMGCVQIVATLYQARILKLR